MKKAMIILLILLMLFLPHTAVCMSAEDFVVSDQVDDNDKYYFYARMLTADMSLEEKAGQLFIVDPDAVCEQYNAFALSDEAEMVFRDLTPGGVMIRGKNIRDEAQLIEFCESMQSTAKQKYGIPLYIAAEEEGGYVERIAMKLGLSNTSSMDEIAQSGYEEDAFFHGEILGKRLKSLGLNMNFAPLAVICANHETDTVSGRYLGEDSDIVTLMANQIVRGMHEQDVTAVMKRFPTENADKGYIDDSLHSLRTVAAMPYQEGIENGLRFILVTNQPVTAMTGSVPASMAKEVCSDWLRNELRFEGIIISDLLTDTAIISQYGRHAAIIQSIQAGCDMFVLKENYRDTVREIVAAVERGELSEERLNQSVIRIVAEKIISGLIE